MDLRRSQEKSDLGDAAECAQKFLLVGEMEARDAEHRLGVGAAKAGGALTQREDMFQRFGETGAALAGDENRGKVAAVEGDDVVFAEGKVGAVGGFDAPADIVEMAGGKHQAGEVKFKPAAL